MTDVWARPLLRRDDLAPGSLAPWLAAALAAGWALVAGLALAGLPGLAVWVAEGATAPVAEPLGIGAAVWLASHRVPLELDGATFHLAPGGLSILIVLLVYHAARWAAHTAGAGTGQEAALVVGVATAGYAAGAGLVAAAAATDHVSAAPLDAVAWTGALALVAAGAGVARQARLVRPALESLPPWVRTCLVAAAVGVAGLVVVGAALVGAGAMAGKDRIGDVAEALRPDLPGAVVLTLASAAIVPNAVVWAAAFALGPGFAVGAETSVAPAGVDVGPVPALPALGALPADDLGTAGWLVLAAPVLVGCVVGVVMYLRAGGEHPWRVAGQALVAGVLAASAMAVLAVLSGGSAGDGRLTVVGPEPGPVGLATLLLLGLPAAAAAATLQRVRPRAGAS